MGDAAYLQFDGVDLYFECNTSEAGEHTSTPTEHAVEQGANVTDHVRSNPRRFSLEVFLSNTPITIGGLADMQFTFVELDVPKFEKPIIPTPGAVLSAGAAALNALVNGKPLHKAAVLKASSKANIVKETIELLEKWRTNAVLGEVIASWGVYKNVVITKVAPSRDASTGDAAKVSLEFTEIRLVEAKMVTAPAPSEPRGQTMVNKGRQPTEDIGPLSDKSTAASVYDLLFGKR